jgi:hypothetical protein
MADAPRHRIVAREAPVSRRRRPASRVKTARRSVLPTVESQSLLDVVDTIIDKGLAVDAEVVLGLADIDLIYLRVGALLAAADRVLDTKPRTSSPRASDALPSLAAPSRGRPLMSSPARIRATTPVKVSSSRPNAGTGAPMDDTSRSVMRLVLTLVEFVRQLLERQAVRRVRERTLTPEEVERLGGALMRLESTVHELALRHGLDPSELNLDLGPLGTLR